MFVRVPILLLLLGLTATGLSAQIYQGAIVVDAADGRVLFEDAPDYRGPPASMTKLMTFLIVHDAIAAGEITLATPVTVTAADQSMGGTQVNLARGEVFAVEDLLYALMIESANDAAHALAHAAAGSRDAFIDRMNARARSLGMTNTEWKSPHGLPPASRRLADTDQTSPRDLATLSLTLLRETDILRYTSAGPRPFGAGVRAQAQMMDNHNNLLGKVHGVDGLKTGFTRAAGFCLSATAERDGRRLVAVIMGAPTSQQRDIKMAELIEYGFSLLAVPELAPVFETPVIDLSTPVTSDPQPAEIPAVRFELPND